MQVCWWDTRRNGDPEGVIPLDQSHIDPVYKSIWINAKSGAEFFTASTDGTVRNKNMLYNGLICVQSSL